MESNKGKISSPFINVDDFIAPTCDESFEILYEDDDILLINKPSGLLSLSGKNPLNVDSVHYRLLNGQRGLSPIYPNARLPHRLDFGTSGIMLVALNQASAKALNKQFQEGSIVKHYIAQLYGLLKDDEGQVNGAIAKDKSIFPRVKICSLTGKPAISRYKVLDRLKQPETTIVQFSPVTGRTHQLRIHSQLAGHPILGCDLYPNNYSEAMANRLLLHASELFFIHPTSKKEFHGVCPCPFY